MNIDQIQKLIRLANNNPNDNEANLAARRVCKMLADYKFPVFNQTRTDHKSPSNPVTNPNANYTRPSSPTGRDPYEEFFKGWRRKYGFTEASDPFNVRPPRYTTTYYDEPKKPHKDPIDPFNVRTSWKGADTDPANIIYRKIIDVIGYDNDYKQYKYKLSCNHVVKYSAAYNIDTIIRCWRCQKEKK